MHEGPTITLTRKPGRPPQSRPRNWAYAWAFGVALGWAAMLGLASPAAAQTYDWSFTVQSVSDGFSGPPTYLNEQIGTGSFTIASSGVATTYQDGMGNSAAAEAYAITSFTGTLAGADITGLGTSGQWASDNTLEIVPGQGWVLAPSGTVVLNTAKPVDGASQLYLSADNFQFGGFIDTANGNEWQGSFDIKIAPAPLPAGGSTAAGAVALLASLGSRGLGGKRRGRKPGTGWRRLQRGAWR